jgi:hypothetical protein
MRRKLGCDEKEVGRMHPTKLPRFKDALDVVVSVEEGE